LTIFSKIFGSKNKKESRIARLLFSSGGGAIYSEKNYENFSRETYLKNVIGFRCILEIAQACSFVDWYLEKRISQDQTEIVTDHEVNNLLHRPNRDNSWSMLMYRSAAFLALSGNTFFEKVRLQTRNAKFPSEMYVLRPDRITLVPGDNGRLKQYEYTTNQGKEYFDIDPITNECDLLHVHTFHPTNDFWGAGPVEPASREIDISNETTDWNMSLIRNQGRPGMVFTIVGDMGDDDFAAFERTLNEKFTGPSNAGKNIVITGDNGTKAEPYSFTPQEMEFVEGSRESARRIALSFGVPPMLLGVPGDNTYCLPADATISTPKGPKEIVNLSKGDFVYSLVDGQMKAMSVSWQGKVGRKQLYKVKTKNREVVATSNHPFLVRESFKIESPNIGKRRSKEIEYRLVYKELKDIKVGDVLVQASSLPTFEESNPYNISIEEMELLGLYLGDGYCSKPVMIGDGKGYKRGGSFIIAASPNASYRNYYLNIVQKLTGSEGHIGKNCVAFGSSSYVRRIDYLGFSGTAHQKRIPEWVFSMPEEYKLALLRGLIDSDGSIDKNGRASFALCNKNLIKDIWSLCLSCSLQVGSVCTREREATLPNGKKFNQIYHIFMISCASDVAKIGTHTTVYKERIQANVFKDKKQLLSATGGNSSFEKITSLLNTNEFHFAKVVDIEKQDVQDVYDIEVNGSHNFIAEGIVVHNSNLKEARQAFYEGTVQFYLNMLCSELNNWLFKPEDKLAIRYDMDNVPALEPRWESKWKRAENADFLTINEKRELTGYEKYEGGDVILVPMGMQTLQMATEEKEEEIENIEDDAKKVSVTDEEFELLMGLREKWNE